MGTQVRDIRRVASRRDFSPQPGLHMLRETDLRRSNDEQVASGAQVWASTHHSGRTPLVPDRAWSGGSSMFVVDRAEAIADPCMLCSPREALLLVIDLDVEPLRYLRTSQGFPTRRAPGAGEFAILDGATRHFVTSSRAVRALFLGLEPDLLGEAVGNMDAAAPATLYANDSSWWRRFSGIVARDEVVMQLARIMARSVGEDDSGARLLRSRILLVIATRILSICEDGECSPSPQTGGLAPWQLRRARELMCRDFESALPLDAVARECGLSRSHFSRAFRASTGLSPHHWLSLRRVEFAQHLLRTSGQSLAEVAAACGYADQGHFTRTFARLVELTPGRWRRLHGRRGIACEEPDRAGTSDRLA